MPDTSLSLTGTFKYSNVNKGFKFDINNTPFTRTNNSDGGEGNSNTTGVTGGRKKERTCLLGPVAAYDITEHYSSLPQTVDHSTKENYRKNVWQGKMAEERGNFFDIFGSSRRQGSCTSNHMEFLHGNVGENIAHKNQHKVSLALHLHVIEVNDLNVPGTSKFHKRYKTINMIGTPRLQVSNQTIPKASNYSYGSQLPSLAENFPGLNRALASSQDFGSDYLDSLTSNYKPYSTETRDLLDGVYQIHGLHSLLMIKSIFHCS